MKKNKVVILYELSKLVQPLIPMMVLAIALGILGYLCAISVPVLSILAISDLAGLQSSFIWSWALGLMVCGAILRGPLRYGEQACNHYIAFKILAVIRNHVFAKLRQLCPAKLEGKEKGNLISMITGDIELLEVFYAHTLSPVFIALITSLFIIGILFSIHPVFAIIAFLSFITIGFILPLYYAKKGEKQGVEFRNQNGDVNSYFLDTLRGIRELIQFDFYPQRKEAFKLQYDKLDKINFDLKKIEANNRAVTDACVMEFTLFIFVCGLLFTINQTLTIGQTLFAATLLFSSFGPVIALSNLSNNLHHTFASAERILSLLNEDALVQDVVGQPEIKFADIEVKEISFRYEEEEIFNHFSMKHPVGSITAVSGKSGSGKSTLIRLLMRFWKVDQGEIAVNQTSLNQMNTSQLRHFQSYMTQDSILFNESLFDNITLAKENATLEEVRLAAKKASIDDWIEQLPLGYNTQVGELGEFLSGGERQRIGLARAFYHDSEWLLLDEPTSNLDSLNEAIILQSLMKEAKQKTIFLVSHRASTLAIADHVVSLESLRKM